MVLAAKTAGIARGAAKSMENSAKRDLEKQLELLWVCGVQLSASAPILVGASSLALSGSLHHGF